MAATPDPEGDALDAAITALRRAAYRHGTWVGHFGPDCQAAGVKADAAEADLRRLIAGTPPVRCAFCGRTEECADCGGEADYTEEAMAAGLAALAVPS